MIPTSTHGRPPSRLHRHKTAWVMTMLLAAGGAAAQADGRQSPINLDTHAVLRAAATTAVPRYQSDATLRVVNTYDTGRKPALDKEWATLRADVPRGSHVTVDGQRYDLLQFHFHTPAEHAVDHARSPMEVHFVHLREGAQPCQPGALLVIGARILSGASHGELDKIFGLAGLPRDAQAGAVAVPHFDIGRVLPPLTNVWRYAGSLTAPAAFDTCTLAEGTVAQQLASGIFPMRVTWMVLRDEIEMSAAQIARFRSLFEEGNARELQPPVKHEATHALPRG